MGWVELEYPVLALQPLSPLCLGQGHNPKLWPPTPLHTLSARPLIIEMYPLHVRTPNTSVVINLNWKLVLDWGVWN